MERSRLAAEATPETAGPHPGPGPRPEHPLLDLQRQAGNSVTSAAVRIQREGGGRGGGGVDALLAADRRVADEVRRYSALTAEAGASLSAVIEQSAKDRGLVPDPVLAAAAAIKIGSGIANLITGGLTGAAAPAMMAIGFGASLAEEQRKVELRREARGEGEMGASEAMSSLQNVTITESLKTGAVGGGAAGAVATAGQFSTAAAEAVTAALPLVGGLAQIGLGLKSLYDAWSLQTAIALRPHVGELRYLANAAAGSADALRPLVGAARSSQTRRLVGGAVAELSTIASRAEALLGKSEFKGTTRERSDARTNAPGGPTPVVVHEGAVDTPTRGRSNARPSAAP